MFPSWRGLSGRRRGDDGDAEGDVKGAAGEVTERVDALVGALTGAEEAVGARLDGQAAEGIEDGQTVVHKGVNEEAGVSGVSRMAGVAALTTQCAGSVPGRIGARADLAG